jgi:putative transposase
MQQGHKFRIYPAPQQASILLRWIGCQRSIYNAKVAEDRYFRAFARKSLTDTGEYAPIDQQYAHFKTDLTPWLNEVPSIILRNGATLWKQSYARFFRRLAKRPTIHKKTGQQSVWITSELFEFIPVINASTGVTESYRLIVGSKKFPIGEIKLNAHRELTPPASIHISVQAGKWHIGFTNDNGMPEVKEADIQEWLASFTEDELMQATVGIDRDVAIKLASSNGADYDFKPKQKSRINHLQKHKKAYQRRMTKQTKGSMRREKTKHHVARIDLKLSNMRHDLAHQSSRSMVSDPKVLLIVFEELKVKNMSASAKGDAIKPGKNVRQKAGLNKSILGSAWGKTLIFAKYKARKAAKCCIEVPPHFSSQECSQCGYIHQDNRIGQSAFICQSCHHSENADRNASKVIARRGVRQILNLGPAGSRNPSAAMQKKLVETQISHPNENFVQMHKSLKR